MAVVVVVVVVVVIGAEPTASLFVALAPLKGDMGSLGDTIKNLF